jgi:hypothetical protein
VNILPKQIYEAWEDPEDNSITFARVESIEYQRSKGLISTNAKLLYRVEAHTYEEAMTIHHEKMGWEPYQPLGSLKNGGLKNGR